MQRTGRIAVVVGATAALAGGGAAAAVAVSEDGERPATGAGAERAEAAALAITGGSANAVERDGEDGATWEVEVVRPDGQQVDVRLDERFRLVVVERDGE